MGYYTANATGNTNGNMVTTNRTGVDRYNTATSAINDWGNANNDNWTNIDSGSYDTRHEYKKKRGHFKKSKSYDDYTSSSVNGSTNNDILNDYVNGTSKLGTGYNLNNNDWSSYANQASDTFNKLYNNTSTNLRDSTVSGYTDAYSPYIADSNYNTLINNKNTSDYNDAVNLLQRDLARGYLSQSGYDTAVNKLNGQTANNLQNLNDLGSAQYKTWNDDLNQIWADNTITPDSNSWMKYYRNWDDNNMNALFDDASGYVGDYANAYINDDMFNNAIDANLYDPDTYAAEGAKYQGMYNPFNRNSGERRKRVTLDNIGEY